MIRQEDGKWFLYTRDGGRRLGGPYDTEAEAQERERQVEHFAKAAPQGLMVAVMLPVEVATRLALPGGLPPGEMHCTLAYCGMLQNLPADAVERARGAAALVAAEFGPFVGLLGGVGRFNASGSSDGKDVLHATLDAPLLAPLREALVAALEQAGLPVRREHGFDPHITLRYEDPAAREQGAPLPAMPTMPAVFQALTVAAGEVRQEVPLTGTRVMKAEAPAPAEPEEDESPDALAKALDVVRALEWRGVPRASAVARAAADAGLPVEEVAKARERSREFLEEAYRLVHEKCPPWVAAAIRDSAKPKAGARARARRREEADSAAPSPLERLALRGVQPAHLADLDEGGIRGSWEKLRAWHGAGKKRAEPVEEVLSAARHFAAEMKRRNLALAEDDELLCAAGPLEKALGHAGRLLKARALPEKRIVYGVVLDPYRVDAHNDRVPADHLEESAHRWFRDYRVINLQHREPCNAVAVESWLEPYPSKEDYEAARRDEPHTIWRRPFGDDAVHSGTWLIGVQLDDVLWKAYLSGEIAAFSIEGFGVKTPVSRSSMPKVTVVDLLPAA